MKKVIVIGLAALACAQGCMSKQTAKIIGQLKDDPATVSTGYRGIYGTFYFNRSNAGTNQSAVVDENGSIKINPK